MGKSIDLHMHSYYSDDGEFTPEELVRKCSDSGIKVMAIADHNSVRANVRGELEAAKAGITYIPAIEIDCTFRGVNLHVLGYGIEYESPDFAEIEDNIAAQGAVASRQMLQATRKMGFQVSEQEMEELAKNNFNKDIWTGEMFAEVLLDKPEYADHPMLRPYRPGGERADNPYVNFYWDYYSQGKCCYVEMEYPDLEQVVDIIHKNKGCAVLAHPGVNLKDRSGLLEPIIETGLFGIEAFSSYHSPAQAAFYYDAARRNG
ncbi:MAG: PHP domain-containing protein, partial [Clostridiales bacterium]|nr:PHP domain-containing protein [Clostridiales bacterium]